MVNLFGRNPQAKTKLEVSRFLTDLHDELKTHEKMVLSLKKSFDHIYSRSEHANELDLKGLYSQLAEYSETVQVYVKNVAPKIGKVHAKLELLERGSKEYAVYGEVVKKIQAKFNNIDSINTHMLSEMDTFYDDHQGVLVS